MTEKDSLKSWVVLFVVTFNDFFTFGSIKVFGVLLPDLKEQLTSHTWIIGSCISLMVAWGYTLGELKQYYTIFFFYLNLSKCNRKYHI